MDTYTKEGFEKALAAKGRKWLDEHNELYTEEHMHKLYAIECAEYAEDAKDAGYAEDDCGYYLSFEEFLDEYVVNYQLTEITIDTSLYYFNELFRKVQLERSLYAILKAHTKAPCHEIQGAIHQLYHRYVVEEVVCYSLDHWKEILEEDIRQMTVSIEDGVYKEVSWEDVAKPEGLEQELHSAICALAYFTSYEEDVIVGNITNSLRDTKHTVLAWRDNTYALSLELSDRLSEFMEMSITWQNAMKRAFRTYSVEERIEVEYFIMDRVAEIRQAVVHSDIIDKKASYSQRKLFEKATWHIAHLTVEYHKLINEAQKTPMGFSPRVLLDTMEKAVSEEKALCNNLGEKCFTRYKHLTEGRTWDALVAADIAMLEKDY